MSIQSNQPIPAWNKEKQTQLEQLTAQHKEWLNHIEFEIFPQVQELIPDITTDQFVSLLENAATIIKILQPHSTIYNI